MKDIALPNGYKVTSWYDRSERSWVSQLLDADGNQIGEAEFDGHRDGLPYSRETLTDRAKALPALSPERETAKDMWGESLAVGDSIRVVTGRGAYNGKVASVRVFKGNSWIGADIPGHIKVREYPGREVVKLRAEA